MPSRYSALTFSASTFDRQADRTVETTSQPFAAMQRRILAVLDGFFASNADRIAFHLYLQIGFADAGKLGDDYQIVALPEYVERWIGAAAAWARSKPTAGAEVVERLLELRDPVYWVSKKHGH
jgi:hypothetical protein